MFKNVDWQGAAVWTALVLFAAAAWYFIALGITALVEAASV